MRVLVRPLGRLTPCLPLRVDFDVHASDALARLISAAALRLNLEVACKSLVKVYLRGGALLDTVDHLEKDDEIYIASDGDACCSRLDAYDSISTCPIRQSAALRIALRADARLISHADHRCTAGQLLREQLLRGQLLRGQLLRGQL